MSTWSPASRSVSQSLTIAAHASTGAVDRIDGALECESAASGAAGLTAAFLATIASLMATVVAVHALQATLRLPGKETAGHADSVLGAAVPRSRWLASHLAVAVVGAPAALLLGALGMGVTASVTADEPHLLPELLGPRLRPRAMARRRPRRRAVRRRAAAGRPHVGRRRLRAVRQHARRPPRLPQWASELSPFGVVPLLPVEQPTIAPLAALTAAAAAAITIGVVGFRHRDLQSPT